MDKSKCRSLYYELLWELVPYHDETLDVLSVRTSKLTAFVLVLR